MYASADSPHNYLHFSVGRSKLVCSFLDLPQRPLLTRLWYILPCQNNVAIKGIGKQRGLICARQQWPKNNNETWSLHINLPSDLCDVLNYRLSICIYQSLSFSSGKGMWDNVM